MVFQVQDYNDLIRLLNEHPEWRAELRHLVLTEELLALPEIVRELADAQKRTEARIEELAEAQKRTEARIEELAEAQKRTEARVEELAHSTNTLTQRSDTFEQRMDALVQRMDALVQRMEELVHAQLRTEKTVHAMADRQNQMLGDLLEIRYARRATGYFGRWLRRVRVILPNSLDPEIEDRLEAHLTHEELLDVYLLDVLAVGRLHQPPTRKKAEVWLAVEVSAIIDVGDVERALRRAMLVRKAGYRAVPVVAGEGVTPEATQAMQDAPIALMLDGRSQGWELALAKA